jgi:hypothetical protein
VSVIVPADAEASHIRAVLATLPQGLGEVLIASAGSGRDALVAALAECSGDVVVMLDPGGTADIGELPRFIDALTAGAALAKGARVVA